MDGGGSLMTRYCTGRSGDESRRSSNEYAPRRSRPDPLDLLRSAIHAPANLNKLAPEYQGAQLMRFYTLSE